VTFSNLKRSLGLVAFVGLTGCQIIAGVQSRTADPPPAQGCVLPSVGSAQIRVVNVGTSVAGTTPSRTDFCIRPSGTTSWGLPIFANGGTDYGDAGPTVENLCTMGLQYSQATVPFNVAPSKTGTIDVKAIPSGSLCTITGTSELDGIKVGATAGQIVTVVRYGGGEVGKGGQTETLVALDELAGPEDASHDYVRVVNALNVSTPLQFGPTLLDSLPTTISNPILANAITSGATPPAQTTSLGEVTAEGYFRVILGVVSYGVSNSLASSHAALAIATTPPQPVVSTFYAIGDSKNTNNTFPVRGLFCTEGTGITAATTQDAGADASAPSAEQNLLQSCVPTAFPHISVDAWDVALYGANAPFEDQRAKAIPAAIAARTADLICLTEVDSLTDRNDIINLTNVPGGYPYSYDVTTTVNTLATDPDEADGMTIPPVPNTPPCQGISSSVIDAAYACMAQNCENPATGGLQGSTNCIESMCINQFLPIYHPDPPAGSMYAQDFADNICVDCILLNVDDPTETLAQGKTTCTTVAAPGYDFQGQMPLLILSRQPFVKDSEKLYVLPSTGLHRGILKEQINFGDGLTVDFFCTQLISPQIDGEVPYVGPYGMDSLYGGPDMSPTNGWGEEQLLEAQDALKWIQMETNNDGVPAIIAGTFYSTIAQAKMGSTPALDSLSPLVMQAIDDSAGASNGFTRAEPPGYARVCDGCPGNAYTPGAASLEFNALFLYGWPGSSASNATESESLWATDNSLPLTAEVDQPLPVGLTDGKGPLSEYYGHNNVLVRPGQ
jgi:hypothetical protein